MVGCWIVCCFSHGYEKQMIVWFWSTSNYLQPLCCWSLHSAVLIVAVWVLVCFAFVSLNSISKTISIDRWISLNDCLIACAKSIPCYTNKLLTFLTAFRAISRHFIFVAIHNIHTCYSLVFFFPTHSPTKWKFCHSHALVLDGGYVFCILFVRMQSALSSIVNLNEIRKHEYVWHS